MGEAAWAPGVQRGLEFLGRFRGVVWVKGVSGSGA